MFQRESYFAWLPVKARTLSGARYAWLETVTRERFVTDSSAGPWRYYTVN